jgi:predicted Fe-S protein YdhL (DUF1289 family)
LNYVKLELHGVKALRACISLLHMLRRNGPFQVIENDGTGVVDSPIEAPRRRYACPNYNQCLVIAASMNWDSFTCRGCSGQIDETLRWRAQQAQRKDQVAKRISVTEELPDGATPEQDAEEPKGLRLLKAAR